MAVGSFIYVGKSRLRKKFRQQRIDNRIKRIEKKRQDRIARARARQDGRQADDRFRIDANNNKNGYYRSSSPDLHTCRFCNSVDDCDSLCSFGSLDSEILSLIEVDRAKQTKMPFKSLFKKDDKLKETLKAAEVTESEPEGTTENIQPQGYEGKTLLSLAEEQHKMVVVEHAVQEQKNIEEPEVEKTEMTSDDSENKPRKRSLFMKQMIQKLPFKKKTEKIIDSKNSQETSVELKLPAPDDTIENVEKDAEEDIKVTQNPVEELKDQSFDKYQQNNTDHTETNTDKRKPFFEKISMFGLQSKASYVKISHNEPNAELATNGKAEVKLGGQNAPNGHYKTFEDYPEEKKSSTVFPCCVIM